MTFKALWLGVPNRLRRQCHPRPLTDREKDEQKKQEKRDPNKKKCERKRDDTKERQKND